MQNNYNMNQTVLEINLDYQPEENNPAWFINEMVESLELDDSYFFGRPKEYNLRAMLKLLLFAYTRSVFSSRRIEQFARENKPAEWLTQGMVPSYRTICRFRISNDLEELINHSLTNLVDYLHKNNLVDDVTFIDGTKILADANKFSFVWKKNIVRFDKMNREKLIELLKELKEAQVECKIPVDSNLSLEMIDEIMTRIELKLDDLNKEIELNSKLSPNPQKQLRRTLKSKKK